MAEETQETAVATVMAQPPAKKIIDMFIETLPRDHPMLMNALIAMRINGAAFVPNVARGDIDTVFYMLERGREWSIPPMAVFDSFYPLLGKDGENEPQMKLGTYANAIRARLRTVGVKIKETLEGELTAKPEEGTLKAVCELTRPDGEVGTAEWTIKDAADWKLLGKFNWSTDKKKKVMLANRALTECANKFCRDLLGCSVWTPEELQETAELQAEHRVVTAETLDASAGRPAEKEANAIDKKIRVEDQTNLREACRIHEVPQAEIQQRLEKVAANATDLDHAKTLIAAEIREVMQAASSRAKAPRKKKPTATQTAMAAAAETKPAAAETKKPAAETQPVNGADNTEITDEDFPDVMKQDAKPAESQPDPAKPKWDPVNLF